MPPSVKFTYDIGDQSAHHMHATFQNNPIPPPISLHPNLSQIPINKPLILMPTTYTRGNLQSPVNLAPSTSVDRWVT